MTRIFPFVIQYEQQVRVADGWGGTEHAGYRRLEQTINVLAANQQQAERALIEQWDIPSYRFEIIKTLAPITVHLSVDYKVTTLNSLSTDGARIIHDTRRL